MNRHRLAASVAVSTVGLLAGLIITLSAGAATGGGTIHAYAISDGTPPSHFVVTGAINTAGTGTPSTAGHVHLTTLSLPGGTLVLNNTALSAATAKGLDAGNPATCTATFTATVPETILRGTGAYAGASGKLTVDALVAAAARKASSGQCGAISLVGWYRATGSISFK